MKALLFHACLSSIWVAFLSHSMLELIFVGLALMPMLRGERPSGSACITSAYSSKQSVLSSRRTVCAGCYSSPFARDPAAERGTITVASGGQLTDLGPWAAGSILLNLCVTESARRAQQPVHADAASGR